MIEKFKIKLTNSLYFLFIILLACDDRMPYKNCNIDHEIITPNKIKDVAIDVKGLQYKHQIAFSAHFDSIDWYIGLDNVRNSLDFFDLTKEMFVKSILIKNDGSEGSIDVSDFYFHNKDSIILFSEQGKIQIRDITDSIINEISLRTERLMEWSKDELTAGLGNSEARIFFDSHKNYLYIPSVPAVYYNEENYYSAPTILLFDIITEEFIEYGTLAPDDVKNHKVTPTSRNDWYNIVNSFENGEILVSYFDSQFYSRSKLNKDDSINLICRKSKFLNDNDDISITDLDDINKEREYIFKKGIYSKSFYHSSFKKYLNSVRHNQEFKNIEGKVNNPYHADFSILVLDEKFNALKEFKIPTGKYNFNKVYPHSEGILIMKENPNDENNEEDLLEFSVFAID